jgi:hypothetical protein
VTAPSEMDRLDPAPAPRRGRGRRIGPEERGVRASLRTIKAADPALAAMALAMAQELDRGEMAPRDSIAARAQIRQCIVQIREWNPSGEQGDNTDEVRARVENIRALYEPEAS